ncbi:MAG: hypothetical protein FWF96_06750, partial [Kiritimatiellaeota bacterium]|nr:hypothetical protein [Kiritimatiellota bacterium]
MARVKSSTKKAAGCAACERSCSAGCAPLTNTPVIKMGVVAVSRNCFPIELSRSRLERVKKACAARRLAIVPCSVVVETEADAMKAVAEM